MKGYVIFIRKLTRDEDELKAYGPMARASAQGHSIKLLAGGHDRIETLEGSEDVEGVIIAEFPTFDEAKAWYDSPVYRAAREHRLKGADFHTILVEGLSSVVAF